MHNPQLCCKPVLASSCVKHLYLGWGATPGDRDQAAEIAWLALHTALVDTEACFVIPRQLVLLLVETCLVHCGG